MRENLRSRMMRVYQLVFDRKLTNVSGGNMTLRVGPNTVYCTRSGGTKRQLGRLTSDDIILADFDGNILDGQGPLTKEFVVHTTIMKVFPSVGAVIHGHPLYASVFAARMEPIPVYLDHMKKFGEIPVVPDNHPVSSVGYAQDIIGILSKHKDTLDKYGFAVLYARHGLTVAAPTVEDALDLMERVEWNAAALVLSRAMGSR